MLQNQSLSTSYKNGLGGGMTITGNMSMNPTMQTSLAYQSQAAPAGNVSLSNVNPQQSLELAGRNLEQFVHLDGNNPPLLEQLKVTTQGGPTVSGLNDTDYPNLPISPNGQLVLNQLGMARKIPLPAELVEHFAHMQSYCMMGIFPEVGRAWLTIDSDIYVWTYEDGGDLAYFDGLSESILGVGLVKPKPGVFQSHIQFLLCLTTPVEIVLLGVSFTAPTSGNGTTWDEMHLLPEPLFSLPTDGSYVTAVVGTDKGRIFMGAKDGCLYELAYQAEDGWFSRRCRKINHSKTTLSYLIPSFIGAAFAEDDPLAQICVDESRHLLYTRSEKGSINVYDLGGDGQSLSRVASLSQNSIVQAASQIARTVDRTNLRPVVSIAAIQESESPHLHLLAVTAAGVRFYFTTLYLGSAAQNVTPKAATLSLVHVRLPPGFAANAPPQRPHKVHTAVYSQGTLLLSSAVTESADVVWMMSPDMFPFQTQLMESHITTGLDGRTWALAEKTPSRAVATHGLQPPLIVTQHMESPKQFIFLTAQGCEIVTKLRPVDVLRKLLVDGGGPDGEGVKVFFQVLKEDQACATSLILASSASVQDVQVAEWATQAFFLYGGDCRVNYQPNMALPPASALSPLSHTFQTGAGQLPPQYSSPVQAGFNPSVISTPQQFVASPDSFQSPSQSFAASGMRSPYVQHQQTYQSTGAEIHYSGKHNGLYLYFSRLIRPLWFQPLVQPVVVGNASLLDTCTSSEEISWILQQLIGLRNFLERNAAFTSAYTDSTGLSRRTAGSDASVHKKLLQDAQNQERQSILALQHLMNHTSQVLGLWKVLCDHRLHVLGEAISLDLKEQLKSMAFRDLILNGQEVCAALITGLINRYLDDNASTDSISARLREVCPSLYKAEDATCSKVNELLLKARTESSRNEKDRLVRQAVDICKQIPHRVNVSSVCQHLQACEWPEGIIELSLAIAAKRDPQDRAGHFYKADEPREDQQGIQAWAARMECYKAVTEYLTNLLNTTSLPLPRNVPRSPGAQDAIPVHTDTRLTVEQILQLCLRSEDELFHVALYDWMIEKQLMDKLLDVKSPFVEAYLKKYAAQHPDSLAAHDLLWKFYEKNKNYTAAARILAKLADAHSTQVPLTQRLEYLSRAILCVKSAEMWYGGVSQGQFLHDLEEKMDVARVQLQVLEAISSLSQQLPQVQEAISRLNADLLDVTQLYEEFAEPLGLWECKLAILHCAGHTDPSLIENIWANIISQELNKVAHSDNQTKLTVLGNKVKSVGKLYVNTERFFPLDYLVKELELKSLRLKGDPGLVLSIMQATGVPLAKLFMVYHRLHCARDSVWHAEGRSTHLLQVLARLLTHFVEAPSLVPAQERRQFRGQCLDAVANYLSDLYCSAEPSAAVLINEFKSIQARLERV